MAAACIAGANPASADPITGQIGVASGYIGKGLGKSDEAQAAVKLTSRDKLSVAYGLRRVENGVDYGAWNLGEKHEFTSAIAGDLRGYDTDGHDLGSRYEGRRVASLSYSF